MRRVEHGERIVVTRDGTPVAELNPVTATEHWFERTGPPAPPSTAGRSERIPLGCRQRDRRIAVTIPCDQRRHSRRAIRRPPRRTNGGRTRSSSTSDHTSRSGFD
ncbi:type II toxin-antitoxin system Phd/YefM family antitoxin [Skermania piniformis]|uniref:type II toxin-antitoxin system Phd/YefM family antitoxin n=1 Tax=Skermania pinensis TaxID=39122 RepID=UPI001FE8609D|nr:hypothetical protein [Skermania piniformis]